MIPRELEYLVPHTLDEAVRWLDARPGAQLLAGGQDLLLRMRQRQLGPLILIDLRALPALRVLGQRIEQSEVHIGAMVTCMELRDSSMLNGAGQVLAEAASSMGDVHVHNRATIGGHLAAAAPAADLAPAVVVLKAGIHVRSAYRERVIAAEDFFTGPLDTALERNELITEITIPVPPPRSGGAYEKIKNVADGRAICGVAALVSLSPSGNIGSCRVAATGITSHPARLPLVEATLEGAAPSPAIIRAASSHATKDLTFRSDDAASGDFRAYLLTVLVEKAISRAAQRAEAEQLRSSEAERAGPAGRS